MRRVTRFSGPNLITRLRRHEPKAMVADLAYLALAGFVAWGRFFGPEPFTG